MRLFMWLVSIVVALFAVVSLPSVQAVFVPLPGEVETMTSECELKPPVAATTHLDVVYKRSLFRSYRLDIYEPLTGAPVVTDSPAASANPAAPVVVFLHGGSWIHGDKITIRVIDRFMDRMRSSGYFVIAVNYTTSVLRGLSGPMANVESAIEWIGAHADEYGYDPHRIGLYGVSAGGHLGLMAASTMESPDFSFSFVFGECAPSDLVAMRNGEAFENSTHMAILGRGQLERFSPALNISDSMPPVLLFHGGADQVVDVIQSERYAAELLRAGVPVDIFIYPEGDHGFLNLPDEVWYEQETEALRYFARQFTGT